MTYAHVPRGTTDADAIDLTLLRQALQSYTRAALARELGVSLPTLRLLLRGHVPHRGIAQMVGRELLRVCAR